MHKDGYKKKKSENDDSTSGLIHIYITHLANVYLLTTTAERATELSIWRIYIQKDLGLGLFEY